MVLINYRSHQFSPFQDIPEDQSDHDQQPSKLKPNIFMQHENDRNGYNPTSQHEQIPRKQLVQQKKIFKSRFFHKILLLFTRVCLMGTVRR